MRWLNYQHLFYFWNIARLGSVTEASRSLRLAQPTLSTQIKSLEEILGEKLFERHGRRLELTEVGRAAYSYAERIFLLGQELLDVIDGKTVGIVRELKIGISDVVPKSLVFRLIEGTFEQGKGSIIQCLEDKTNRLLSDLVMGELDLVIADRPIPPGVKIKAYNHFVGDSGVSFLAKGDLARKFRRDFPRSLSGAPLLLPTPEAAIRAELDKWMDSLEIHPSQVAYFQDRALMKLAARAGLGIAPIPTVLEREIKKEFHLELVGRASHIKEEIYLITLDKKIKNSLIKDICDRAQVRLSL